MSEPDYIKKKSKWLPKIKEWVDKNDPGATMIPLSCALELKLSEMPEDGRQAYLKEHGITSSLDKIIVNGYRALQLQYFFTAGEDEVKAWTILVSHITRDSRRNKKLGLNFFNARCLPTQKNTKAPQAAGRIHTDFEKGFIMAEIMNFNDFKELGTETAVKAAGKYRQQGRNYTVEGKNVCISGLSQTFRHSCGGNQLRFF